MYPIILQFSSLTTDIVSVALEIKEKLFIIIRVITERKIF